MLRTPLLVFTFALLPLQVQATDAVQQQLMQKAAQSKQVVQIFMKQLKGELQSAMKAGGPLEAIDVCHTKAPLIADNLSREYGWEIGRTSLKTRNPANHPDAWEQHVLETFEKRKAAGEAVKPMAYFERVENDGVASFRFMKAIPTGAVCLKCHGASIDAQVQAKINSLYPDDQATGFKQGDIRGAFTITQPW